MQRTTVIVLASAMLLLASPVRASVFFSEYVEGSSNNKALEIYNNTGAALDLAANLFSVRIYFNGQATFAQIALSGTLAPNGVHVISHSSASFAAIADQTSSALNFNGNDAVVLFGNGVTLDVFGQVGFDPGTAWTSEGVTTVNSTLRRRTTVLVGDINPGDAFVPSEQWHGFAVDTIDGLGSHTVAAIPEPHTYGLLLAGLGLLGFAARRRRK